MGSDDSDAGLVLAARAGDKGAFATLLVRHRGLLLALCRRLLRDVELAEDAAQEAALQALLTLDRLRRPERFGPWLAGIGLNVCRLWLRERRADAWSWEALVGGRQVREPLDRRPGPEEVAAAADLAARVQWSVAGLPPGQRIAVLLVYLAGLSQAEVAATLGIDTGAVKARLHKARATLRERLWADWKEDRMTAVHEEQPRVHMRVADVLRTPETEDRPQRHVVVLEEVGGQRRLPIWIGHFEGEMLVILLRQVDTPRPLTLTFAANVLQAAGGRLREVRVHKLVDETFYAEAAIEGSGGLQVVDARPSDALSLALTVGAPIYVDARVLEAAALRPDTPPLPEGTVHLDQLEAEIREKLAKWPWAPR
jgi:RNA polymerase sigma factor (sigma-70 family)